MPGWPPRSRWPLRRRRHERPAPRPPCRCRPLAHPAIALEAAAAHAGTLAHRLGRPDRGHPPPVPEGAGGDRHGCAAARGARHPAEGGCAGRWRARADRPRHHRGGAEDAALRIHLPCAQPRAQHPHRRQVDRLRAGGRPAQLLRPRPGPEARHAGGRGQFREARAVLQHRAHGGRRLRRCARCPCLDPASPHHAQQDGLFGQGALHLCHGPRAAVRRAGDRPAGARHQP